VSAQRRAHTTGARNDRRTDRGASPATALVRPVPCSLAPQECVSSTSTPAGQVPRRASAARCSSICNATGGRVGGVGEGVEVGYVQGRPRRVTPPAPTNLPWSLPLSNGAESCVCTPFVDAWFIVYLGVPCALVRLMEKDLCIREKIATTRIPTTTHNRAYTPSLENAPTSTAHRRPVT
jgi:hypothetical protein